MFQLDDKDRRLLAALKKNSRASLVALARDIGLSRSATHDRVTRLEECGAITAYTITIDDQARPKIRAFLTVRLKNGYENSIVTDAITKRPGVEATYCLTGDIDLFVYCECSDVTELSATRDEISLIDGVTDIITRNVLSTWNG